MPRPRHAQGRPGTAVIPLDWAATHAVPAAKTMVDALATLREPGSIQAWSDSDDEMVAVPKAAYAVDQPCRVQALDNQGREFTSAEDPVTISRYLVVVPATLNPSEKHLVAITGSPDPSLNDRVLEVQQVVRGSIRWERDLFCTLID